MVYMNKGGYIKLVDESAIPKWKALGFTVMTVKSKETGKKGNGKDGD